ncbi:NBS-LRR class resistance Fy8-Ry8 [Olea europaea subsp. europaea]|uniref:NBS-LRR class resistance Fy8-Ry8 n=1 Tax=Olea europaea subsp. europaea TaxID=158383 RepID=A0A8S0STE8_OLEEU|nr:NBS-LRR class resistance Fy8-Ry8 [Olea europaea subsp. europaea]
MMSDIELQADLQKISTEIDSIVEEAGKIIDLEKRITEIDTHVEEAVKINDGSGEQNLHTRKFSQSKPAPGGQNSVVGFVEYLKKVKDRLCNEEQPQFQIIPIVGMGGSGKTTLALSIFDDSYVKYYFDIRAWVTLSQQYHVQNDLLSLLDNIVVVTDDICKVRDEQLKDYIHKNLKCKRYLIVVDDVWTKKAWNEIQMLFPNGNNGSRIILTTRLSDVADYVGSSNTRHQMHFLNEEEVGIYFSLRCLEKKIAHLSLWTLE